MWLRVQRGAAYGTGHRRTGSVGLRACRVWDILPPHPSPSHPIPPHPTPSHPIPPHPTPSHPIPPHPTLSHPIPSLPCSQLRAKRSLAEAAPGPNPWSTDPSPQQPHLSPLRPLALPAPVRAPCPTSRRGSSIPIFAHLPPLPFSFPRRMRTSPGTLRCACASARREALVVLCPAPKPQAPFCGHVPSQAVGSPPPLPRARAGGWVPRCWIRQQWHRHSALTHKTAPPDRNQSNPKPVQRSLSLCGNLPPPFPHYD